MLTHSIRSTSFRPPATLCSKDNLVSIDCGLPLVPLGSIVTSGYVGTTRAKACRCRNLVALRPTNVEVKLQRRHIAFAESVRVLPCSSASSRSGMTKTPTNKIRRQAGLAGVGCGECNGSRPPHISSAKANDGVDPSISAASTFRRLSFSQFCGIRIPELPSTSSWWALLVNTAVLQ